VVAGQWAFLIRERAREIEYVLGERERERERERDEIDSFLRKLSILKRIFFQNF
jgi:hypothetical protein